MRIWVDGDACPRVIKDILFRAVERTGTPLTLVANQRMQVPSSAYIDILVVAAGPDVADDEIATRCQPGDLVITADIPLAARIVARGIAALDPRGRLYTPDNIKQILAMRDFMDTLRGSAMAESGGPDAFGSRDKNAFANQLDRLLAQKPRA